MDRRKVSPDKGSVRLQEHALGWVVRYREFGSERERLFTDERAAEAWVEEVGVDRAVRPEEMRYLLAADFIAWVADYIGGVDLLIERCGRSNRWARACYRWRSEVETVSVYTADEFLCWLNGPHLSEVPEEFYVDWNRRIARSRETAAA